MTTNGSPTCFAPRWCVGPGRAPAPGSTSAPTRAMITRPRAQPGRPGAISSTSPIAGRRRRPAARPGSAHGAGWSRPATPGSTGSASSWSGSRRRWPIMMACLPSDARSFAGVALGFWDRPLARFRGLPSMTSMAPAGSSRRIRSSVHPRAWMAGSISFALVSASPSPISTPGFCLASRLLMPYRARAHSGSGETLLPRENWRLRKRRVDQAPVELLQCFFGLLPSQDRHGN